MNYFESWNEAVVVSLQNVWINLIGFVPQIIGALVVLVIGLIIAGAFGRVARKLVKLTHLDDLMETLGVDKELKRVGLGFTPSAIVGWIVKWFILIAILIAIADILQWEEITSFLEDVALYIPNVIVAVVILVIGLIAGQFVAKVVTQATNASNIAKAHATLLASVAKWAIVVFTLMASLIQLGIAADLLRILFTGFVTMLAIAGGLAFGLGGKDKAKGLLDNITHKG
jgi:hypothetical protein